MVAPWWRGNVSTYINMLNPSTVVNTMARMTSKTRTACCAPLSAAPLTAKDADLLATRLKAVADPARLRALSLVLAAGDEGACICDLTGPLRLSQPTVSHHLKVLHDAGLVSREQRGIWAYF